MKADSGYLAKDVSDFKLQRFVDLKSLQDYAADRRRGICQFVLTNDNMIS